MMTPLDVELVRLLFAAVGSMAAACAVWIVLVLCSRYSPALAQQRSLWLLGQAAVAAVFVVMLLPTGDRLRVAPVIEIGESAARVAPSPTAHSDARPAPVSAPTPAAASSHGWLRNAGRAWLILYLCGLGYALYRWRVTQRLLHALAASGEPLANLDGHAGFAMQAQAALPPVIEVDAPISPMLQGLFKPRLLLPRHLRSFDTVQQQLIVQHELTHWRRHDIVWSTAALVLQGLFWFNPLMRSMRVRLGWAQEFGCDRAVLQTRPQGQRKAYAAALVAQMKLQQGSSSMALAFGASGEPTLTARVNLIRSPAAAPGRWPRWTAFGGLAIVLCANLALQPALSVQTGGASGALAGLAPPAALLDCTVMLDAASGDQVLRKGICDQRVTPASTFKIAISLMGFDSGLLRDEQTPRLPYKESYAAWNPSWRYDTDPAGWLRESVVWYSQQVTQHLGAEQVRSYVRAFNYGNADLSSVAGVDEAVALSELSPTLKISPLEQTAFLRKLVNRELPVSAHAHEMTSRLLKVATLANGWQVYGKTGTALTQRREGRDEAIGWFVGWAHKDGRTLVFARMAEQPVRTDGYAGPRMREAFLKELAQSRL